MEFSQDAKKEFERLLTRYPEKEAALLPALHLAQKEFGYISPEAEAYVAGLLELPVARVHGVSTFYTMYNKKPVGKYHVQVCTNIACMILGSDGILSYIEKKIGIKAGQTTPDNRYTLTAVECLGSCGTAPVMQINDDYFESLTEEKVDAILASLK